MKPALKGRFTNSSMHAYVKCVALLLGHLAHSNMTCGPFNLTPRANTVNAESRIARLESSQLAGRKKRSGGEALPVMQQECAIENLDLWLCQNL